MRHIATIILVLALTLGCTTAVSPSGAKLRATGQSTASLTVGTLILETGDDGTLRPVACEPWTDTAGIEQPCEHLEVTGGAFTGWQSFLSVASLFATVWGAAR